MALPLNKDFLIKEFCINHNEGLIFLRTHDKQYHLLEFCIPKAQTMPIATGGAGFIQPQQQPSQVVYNAAAAQPAAPVMQSQVPISGPMLPSPGQVQTGMGTAGNLQSWQGGAAGITQDQTYKVRLTSPFTEGAGTPTIPKTGWHNVGKHIELTPDLLNQQLRQEFFQGGVCSSYFADPIAFKQHVALLLNPEH